MYEIRAHLQATAGQLDKSAVLYSKRSGNRENILHEFTRSRERFRTENGDRRYRTHNCVENYFVYLKLTRTK